MSDIKVEGSSTSGGVQTIPFYLVCDESASMSGDSIDAVNEGIKQLCQTISRDPLVDDKARVGIIAFSDTAEVILPLTQISQVGTIPSCVTKASTSYREAFVKLKAEIDNDINQMKANGMRVGRPVVFFISDGAPNDEDWMSAHSDLTSSSNKFRPNIISFGVAGAVKDVIHAVATEISQGNAKRYAYLAEEGTSPGPALKEILQFVTGSVVSSARENTPTIPQAQIPGVMIIDEL